MESWNTASATLKAKITTNWRTKPLATSMTIAGVVVLVVFLVWVIAKMVDSGSRINTVTDGVVSMAQPTTIDGGRIPRFTNGTEYGISMWLYVNEPPKALDSTPILSVGGTSIFAFENGSAVTVTFPASRPNAGGNADAGQQGQAANSPSVSFKHVSLKRWVHLMAVHVDRTVTLFKDGEIFSVTQVVDGSYITNPAGSIRIGGTRPCDAFVSSVVFLNHYPSDKQVKRIYRSGPKATNMLFRMMGFANVGLRSPVYRISA